MITVPVGLITLFIPFILRACFNVVYVRQTVAIFKLQDNRFKRSADINECDTSSLSQNHSHLSHNCHPHASCTNMNGSFHCTCYKGYAGDGIICKGESVF